MYFSTFINNVMCITSFIKTNQTEIINPFYISIFNYVINIRASNRQLYPEVVNFVGKHMSFDIEL